MKLYTAATAFWIALGATALATAQQHDMSPAPNAKRATAVLAGEIKFSVHTAHILLWRGV